MTSLVGWFHDAGRANVGESRNGTLRENPNRYRSRATTPNLRCRRTKTAVAADARTPKNGRLRESTRRSVVCGPKSTSKPPTGPDRKPRRRHEEQPEGGPDVRRHGQGNVRSEERRVGKECRSRWSPYP